MGIQIQEFLCLAGPTQRSGFYMVTWESEVKPLKLKTLFNAICHFLVLTLLEEKHLAQLSTVSPLNHFLHLASNTLLSSGFPRTSLAIPSLQALLPLSLQLLILECSQAWPLD